MSEWVIYTLLATLLWGVWGLLLKISSNMLSGWVSTYILSSTSSFAIALTTYLIMRPQITLSKGSLLAITAGTFGGLGYIAFLKALEVGKASLVVPLTALYPAVTAVLTYLIIRESISPVQLLGVVLALVAAVLISIPSD